MDSQVPDFEKRFEYPRVHKMTPLYQRRSAERKHAATWRDCVSPLDSISESADTTSSGNALSGLFESREHSSHN